MLRPFDAIFTRPKNFDIISSPIAALAEYSHVRTYVKGLYQTKDGKWPDFFHATFPRCCFGYMSEINRDEVEVKIGRHKDLYWPLPKEISDKGINTARRLEGTLYDLGELLVTQFLAVIGLEKIDNSDPNKYVCSSCDEWIRTAMGFSFCPGDLIVSPADEANSPLIEWVEE